MKFIGTKQELVERWRNEADRLRALAALSTNGRHKDLYQTEAYTLENCASDLEMLEIITEEGEEK